MTTSVAAVEKEPLEAVLERLERIYGEELSRRDHARIRNSKNSNSGKNHDKQEEATLTATATGASTNGTSTPSSEVSSSSSGGESLPEYDDPDTSMLPILVAICLVQHNEPSDFARLFEYFANSSKHSSTILLSKLVLRLRTALFKAVPLVGVPRIINALSALHQAVSKHPRAQEVFNDLPLQSTKPTKTTEEDSAAGWAFFKAIYAQHAEKIIERIGETSPDLAEMIVDELYGANLSRTEVLSWKETVLLEFTGW